MKKCTKKSITPCLKHLPVIHTPIKNVHYVESINTTTHQPFDIFFLYKSLISKTQKPLEEYLQ